MDSRCGWPSVPAASAPSSRPPASTGSGLAPLESQSAIKAAPILIGFLAALFIAACGGTSAIDRTPVTPPPEATTTPDVWATLRQRPLELPWQAPSEPCPTTAVRNVSNFPYVLGDGPIYAAVGLRDGEIIYAYADGSEWGISKVLWLSSPDYSGPALIRGYQLDGTNELRFMTGADPPSELQFPLEGSDSSPELEPGWRQLGSETRVRAPGCYAYQVDGPDFREVIVFSAAEDVPSP